MRFRAFGARQFVHLGYSPEWSRQRAEDELANVMADVRRGIWRAPQAVVVPEPPARVPTFHEFASEWFEAQQLEGGRNGRA